MLAAALIGLLASTAVGNATPGLWESNGPAYPAIDLIAIAPDDENVLYAAAHDPVSGGSALFRSPDGGERWNKLADSPAGETLLPLPRTRALAPRD